jgi:hypothetical protein
MRFFYCSIALARRQLSGVLVSAKEISFTNYLTKEVSMNGKEVAQGIRGKVDEFNRLCAGIDEATASRAPQGRWSPKEIVSHLLGADGAGMMAAIKMFLDYDVPELDLVPEQTHFSGSRADLTFQQLIDRFDKEYGGMADLIAELSPEQLSRTAHVPLLKESPMGEYPSLAAFAGGIADYHLGFHIDHMREILQGLGVSPKT